MADGTETEAEPGAGTRTAVRASPARLVRGAVAMLPPGTALVGAGTAVLGLAGYVQLAVAGHVLSADRMAGLSVLWTLVFSVGLGLFFPVEQEITRLVAARVVAGGRVAPVLRRGLGTSLLLLAAVCALSAVLARPLAGRLFDGDLALVGALCAAFAGLSVAHVTRGVLAGTGRFRAYGFQLALDGTLRVVLSVLLALAHVRTVLPYAAILALPTLVSVLVTGPAVVRAAGSWAGGERLPWRALATGLAALVPSTLLAQALVNASVVSAKLLSAEDTAFITALLSAVVLARVPLFVFGSLQASLLRGLSSAVAAGDRATFRQLLLRTTAFTLLLGGVGGLAAVVAGPWLVPRLFGSPHLLGAADFAWLSGGTLLYMLASVHGQVLQTMGGHRRQLAAWTCGIAALLLVTAAPVAVRDRVEIAYAVGAAVTEALLAGMAYVTWTQPRRGLVRQTE
ncbi:lipopolysaccharide biosynthesis protein [Streptomyces sp. NPDC020983]|uniref:lipopolysaccharide biosynthesis protein n=1 Tax=Streptomyces sp. NPDC020983 TaxID=3365106 RepID=UPI0037A5DCC4